MRGISRLEFRLYYEYSKHEWSVRKKAAKLGCYVFLKIYFLISRLTSAISNCFNLFKNIDTWTKKTYSGWLIWIWFSRHMGHIDAAQKTEFQNMRVWCKKTGFLSRRRMSWWKGCTLLPEHRRKLREHSGSGPHSNNFHQIVYRGEKVLIKKQMTCSENN